jgi:ribosome-associated toxin RatA of RatAB toxin-antitoxin module
MRQELTTDTVERYIEAPPETLYDLVADVTRTPELTPDIARVTWLDGATEPAVGARFKAINTIGHMRWSNKPVITALEPGRAISWSRTEAFGGTVEWHWRFDPEGTGTRVTHGYEVTDPITRIGWFIIGTLGRRKDRKRDLHESMGNTLERIAQLTEVKEPST